MVYINPLEVMEMILLYLALLENPEDESAFLEMYHTHLQLLTSVGQKYFTDKWFIEEVPIKKGTTKTRENGLNTELHSDMILQVSRF